MKFLGNVGSLVFVIMVVAALILFRAALEIGLFFFYIGFPTAIAIIFGVISEVVMLYLIYKALIGLRRFSIWVFDLLTAYILEVLGK